MTTDRELMQQALDALDAHSWEQVQAATAALRARLAQPEPEPVAWIVNGELEILRRAGRREVILYTKQFTNGIKTPLYTDQPRREWQSLTDEEAKKVFNDAHCNISADLAGILSRAIEGKLKEKNCI